ncbi:hypothetical protein OkiPb01528_17750 [Escherichia coli]
MVNKVHTDQQGEGSGFLDEAGEVKHPFIYRFWIDNADASAGMGTTVFAVRYAERTVFAVCVTAFVRARLYIGIIHGSYAVKRRKA